MIVTIWNVCYEHSNWKHIKNKLYFILTISQSQNNKFLLSGNFYVYAKNVFVSIQSKKLNIDMLT